MNLDPEIRSACSEEFEELCALFTAAALTPKECERLEKHVRGCEKCRAALAEYNDVATDGMAKVATILSVGDEAGEAEHIWVEAGAEQRAKSLILQGLKAGESKPTRLESHPLPRNTAGAAKRPLFSPGGMASLLRIAAVLVFGLAVGYGVGVKMGPSHSTPQARSQNQESSIGQELADLRAQREALNSQLAATSKTINDLSERSKREERVIAELNSLKASLDARTEQLTLENRQQAESVGSLSAERAALQHKLEDSQRSLQSVRDDLNRLQDERQKALLGTASLETRIDELSAQLRESNEALHRQEEFLASDRDIRDLIGARQLYIADVFDVDGNGQKRKPFGRVFYTKGKSLIFYAFDLDQQPGFRKAKAFQVWGSPGEDQSHAVSLGLFYMDSEAHRRWVLKSDDPVVLAQINSVFVTLEPKGESKTPSGKPILYAYLRTAPANHP